MVLEQFKIKSLVTSSSSAFSAERIEKPHSLASIEKAKTILGYIPSHNLEKGLMEAVEWYWGNLK